MTDEYRQAQLEGMALRIVPRTPNEQHILNEIVIDHADNLFGSIKDWRRIAPSITVAHIPTSAQPVSLR